MNVIEMSKFWIKQDDVRNKDYDRNLLRLKLSKEHGYVAAHA